MASHGTANPPLAEHPANVELVRAIKEERIPLRIPIFDDQGREIGSQRPLTNSAIDNTELIETFVRWRNRHREGWLDQRPVTIEGTRLWLREVITNPTRMTVLLYFGEKLIGRGGFLNLTADDNESDGLVRGESGGGSRFIHYAQAPGMAWQFRNLGIKSIFSKVLSTNELAIQSCERLGYCMEPFKIARVYRHYFPEGAVLREEGDPEQLMPDTRLLYFRVWRDDFFRVTGCDLRQ